MDNLPNELISNIISYLDIKSAKQISFTSKKLRTLALQRMWSKPRFNRHNKDMDFVQQISRFPIREIHTRQLSCCSWLELVAMLPHLKLLHIDTVNYYEKAVTAQQSQLRFITQLPVVVNTNAFKMTNNGEIMQLYECMKSINVERMIINHDCFRYTQHRWTFDQFKMFADKFSISFLVVDCIFVNEENVEDFIRTVAHLGKCKVVLKEPIYEDGSYLYTLKDIELMVKLNIRVTKIESRSLRIENDVPTLLKFADLFRQMKYLKDISFGHGDFEKGNLPPMEKLIDLPFTTISTWNFAVEKWNIKSMVDILHRMKYLKEFSIETNYDVNYKLSVEEFSWFKTLPVNLVYLEALDLTKVNIPEFREIMKGMRIKTVDYFEENFEDADFEIDIKYYGPIGDEYSTV
uniref:F-box domain-containing protein n=1 Tax=Clytia hemisphaerica TaxID=252671 RepID=A0A7M5V4Q0_9CNID|eukprot:TCONS_00015956-protein